MKVENNHRSGEADTGEDERCGGETKQQELPRLNLTDGQTNLSRSFLASVKAVDINQTMRRREERMTDVESI